MREWLENIAGPAFAPAMLWTLAALLGLLVLLVLVKIVRSLTFGTFVSGGRGRKTRLAVMDAAAVDSHRRLVLVRRDDVEHLILIGGPTDVVVEQNIRLLAAPRRPAEEPVREAPIAVEERRPRQPEPQPVAVEPVAAPRPAAAVAPPRPAPQPVAPLSRPPEGVTLVPPAENPRPVAPRPVVSPSPAVQQLERHHPEAAQRSAPAVTSPERPAAVAPPRPVPVSGQPGSRFAEFAAKLSPNRTAPIAPVAAATAAPIAAAERVNPPAHLPPPANQENASDLDDALLAELDATLDAGSLEDDTPLPTSVEDEMSKLLGELSRPPRR